jgi:L,D-transpeptidase YcbB
MLRTPHNRDMENVVAHSQPGYGKPAGTTLPPGVSFASNSGFSSGPSFFERLFGGPPTPPAPIGRRAQQQRFTR